MNHFLKKNFSTVGGAGGGGGGKGDPPSPPTLNPPKLGALSALTSYSYSESIDALCEGPIDGIVNGNGQYLQGHRIFEGIYIDDVPVKKTIDPLNEEISKTFVSLEDVILEVTSPWITNGEFQEKSLNSLSVENFSYDSGRTVNDPYESYKVSSGNLSAEIVYGKKNIAKALFKGVSYINRLVNDSSARLSSIEATKHLQLQFGELSTYNMVESRLLKDFPSSTEYPFFCIKINLGNFYDPSDPIQDLGDFSVGRSTNFILEDDVSNQLFQRLEISEIGKKRTLNVPRYINLSTFLSDAQLKLCGHLYIFGVHENGFPTRETILKIRSGVKKLHIVNFNQEKYNYSNILAEIRNGDELQNPLGFFDKTYLDKVYGTKLLGPFSNFGDIAKLTNFSQTGPASGIIDNLKENSTESTPFSSPSVMTPKDEAYLVDNYGLASYYNKDGDDLAKTKQILQIYSAASKNKRTITVNGTDFTIAINFYNTWYSYNYIKISKIAGVYSVLIQYWYRVFSVNGDYWDIKNFSINGKVYDYDARALVSAAMFTASYVEGSVDSRSGKNYSDWSESSLSQLDEEPNPVVHVVQNPNVEKVYVTMGIRVLNDTAETLRTLAGTNVSVDAGSKIPTVVKFKVETGLQTLEGEELPPTQSIVYQVVGIAESPALIDIGREENNINLPSYNRFIQGTESAASPIVLPPATSNTLRYVRVTRTTYETYSSLVRREISLEKITEIIPAKFSYPNTAIAGIKLDSRTLSTLPPRSYDVRMKRILVPSNYYPLHPDGSDKRLYKTTADFAAAETSDKLVYDGEWDGTFKESWSDNPAWILFDLLINRRYGMGNYVSADQINIWELYKIGRFCDAVDDSGLFYGVPSASGGLEPRYSCNIIIADKVNVFDAIKNLVSTFRGNIFYSNSYIDFTDDRVKLPTHFFNNQNVRDGIFNYTNSRRDQQYNTLEVSYFDRDDSFKVKTEYIEDPEDIKKRGVLRSEIDTFGVTSRAHANRIGKHIIYSTINENQAVSFVCGPEILSCRPGDLISVEDDLKSLQKNVGRVLDIDYSNKVLRLDEQFDTGVFLNEVSLFVPTGQKTYSDYYNLAVSPSKLSMNELYSNDVPQIATFKTTGYQNLDYGCNLYLNQTGENVSLLNKAKVGGIYSITLSGLKQEIYKLTSVRENSPIEYEVAAIKFDTGKFGSIESGQSLVDFYNNYPNVSSPTQGDSSILQNSTYQLGFPVIYNLSTGNYDQQADSIDVSGAWSGVNGATHYDYELVTPRYNSITGRTTGLSATFTDQTQAGRFTLRVMARNESSVPNPIGPTYSSGITVLSYSAPVRTNSVFAGINIKNS